MFSVSASLLPSPSVSSAESIPTLIPLKRSASVFWSFNEVNIANPVKLGPLGTIMKRLWMRLKALRISSSQALSLYKAGIYLGWISAAALLVTKILGYQELSDYGITIVQIVVTVIALQLSHSILPSLAEIRKNVVGRENYIRKAKDIYNSSQSVSALIEGWDANDQYMWIFEKGSIGTIRFLGPIDPRNMSVLGALARINVRNKRPDGADRLSIKHIDVAKVNFKFVIGDSSVLLGEEYGVRDQFHGSDSGYLLTSDTDAKKYLVVFKREFDTLWEIGIDAEKRIADLAQQYLSNSGPEARLGVKGLLESIVDTIKLT